MVLWDSRPFFWMHISNWTCEFASQPRLWPFRCCTSHTSVNPLFHTLLVRGPVKPFSKFGNFFSTSRVCTRDLIMDAVQYLKNAGSWHHSLQALSFTILRFPYAIRCSLVNAQWISLHPQDLQFSWLVWNICPSGRAPYFLADRMGPASTSSSNCSCLHFFGSTVDQKVLPTKILKFY